MCYGSLLSMYSCRIMLLSNDGCDLCFLETKPYCIYSVSCTESDSIVTEEPVLSQFSAFVFGTTLLYKVLHLVLFGGLFFIF